MLIALVTANVVLVIFLIWLVLFRSRRQHRRFHTLQENAGDAVVVINAKGKLVHVSASIDKVLGYTINELGKMDFISLVHLDDLELVLSVMNEARASPGIPVKGLTRRMLHADGSWHWYESVVTNMLHDVDIKGIVDNFRDVTETVLAEERTRNANRLYGFISQINQAIVQVGSEGDLFRETCRIARDFGKFKMVWVGTFNVDKTTLSLSKGCGIPDSTLISFDDVDVWQHGPMFQVLETGTSYVCNDISCFHHDRWREFAEKNEINSFMVLPLRRTGEIVGTLNLYSSTIGLFNEEECTLLEEVAGDISFALNAFERDQLREKAEKKLRDSELRLKQAQSIANVGSFEIDFATGISTWSEELCRIYGFEVTNNRHPYLDWFSMVHPEDIQHVRDVTAQASVSLESSAIYHRIIRPDGSIRHIFSQGEYDLDENGERIGMHGVAHDITEIKESEGARYQSEQNLQLIMDLIPQGIFIKDKHGRYLFVNKSFASLYNVNATEFLANVSHELKELEWGRDEFLAQDQKVILSGQPLTIPEMKLTKPDGTVKYFYTVKVPYNLSGSAGTGILGIALDITEQKQADLERARMVDDLQRRNKDLEQFSYVVSHNVRAPLANIIALISLLDRGDDDEEASEVRAALKSSTDKLDSVIMDLNQILNMNHEFTEAMELVFFSELVDDIKIAIANLIESSGINLTTDFKGIDHTHCFKSYLHSIFYNLVLNSIKYRRLGVVSMLHISSDMDNGRLVLQFRDNGLGIDLSKFDGELFGLYKRFHPGIEGKGMGLYMVKVQVEKLRGTISVESEVGVGTTFKIVFEKSDRVE
ncbi:MAG: PAS domain S-box protein [Bacteroidia bacterium]